MIMKTRENFKSLLFFLIHNEWINCIMYGYQTMVELSIFWAVRWNNKFEILKCLIIETTMTTNWLFKLFVLFGGYSTQCSCTKCDCEFSITIIFSLSIKLFIINISITIIIITITITTIIISITITIIIIIIIITSF